VRYRRLPLLLLIGGGVAMGGPPHRGHAENPAIYLPGLPGLNVPDMKAKPEEAPQTGPTLPQGTDREGARRGEVVVGPARAVSGDTIRVQDRTFRLWGIAAPAMNEFGGYTSMQGLAGLIVGKAVTCVPTPAYIRSLRTARCRVEQRDLAGDMVARGLARDCPRQSNGTYALIERRAVIDVSGGFKLPDECLAPY
jgi:endonuclease YncB( thermonuclease family)